MKYNSGIHHRRSVRLCKYDYSQAGLYFITMCTANRKCLFGDIVDGKMSLNNAGQNANECWWKITDHFPNTALHKFIVMPNHVHGIIEITVGANNYSPLPPGTSKTIGSIVRGFKIGVTKWFRINMPFEFSVGKPVWQRNYYEHIIRNEKSYRQISEYIQTNRLRWREDRYYE